MVTSMLKQWRTSWYLPVFVFATCLTLVAVSTHAFNSLTWEAERQRNIAATQPNMHFLRTIDVKGNVGNLAQMASNDGKVHIVEFVYTRCRALCLVLGSAFQQAQTEISNRHLQDKIGLLSISFDVAKDTPQALVQYQHRMRMDPTIWSIMTMQDADVLEQTTQQLGLIVLQDQGEYLHNSAFLVMNQQGYAVGLFPPEDIHSAIQLALSLV